MNGSNNKRNSKQIPAKDGTRVQFIESFIKSNIYLFSKRTPRK